MSDARRFLVIGGDGVLGSHLASRLRSLGDVVQTTRRPALAAADCPLLDLTGDVNAWRIPDGITAAVLCAGISGLNGCRSDREHSEFINVTQTIELASRLSHRGIHVIYPSSNRVFDGTKAFCTSAEPTSPATVYGRQKVAVETALASLDGSVTILRLTKVISRHVPLIAGWERNLRASQPIHPFRDSRYAPVSLRFVGDVFTEAAVNRRVGLWHVSSDGEVSYETTARELARLVGCSEVLIEPVSAFERSSDREDIAAYSVLDTRCLEKEFGIDTPHALDSLVEGLAS